MANLSSLVHELRERIAMSSSTPLSKGDNDPALETRFRAVIPNLLRAYVVPSSTATEREVIAVLKLLTHTANNFPGVFNHGKSIDVLPIIGRILPFFAEPSFGSRHGVIFETVGSLISLLRAGDRDAYRRFFVDTMLVVEDLLHVATLSKGSNKEANKVSLRCFSESMNAKSTNDESTNAESTSIDSLCELPACLKPAEGYGIVINVTGKKRWQPFATWVIKLLCRSITEGILQVEGLIHVSFVSDACNLLCYGDASLQMACFDFARIIGALMNQESIPSEKLILSISTILSDSQKGFPVFSELPMYSSGKIVAMLSDSDIAYDSSIGGSLQSLHSSCSYDVVKLTAVELINVFPVAMQKTKSEELKNALCSAYTRIAKSCGPQIWEPESLIFMLYSSKPCLPLIECLQVAVSILGPDLTGEDRKNDVNLGPSMSGECEVANLRVGEKRPSQIAQKITRKRQKIDEELVDCKTDSGNLNKLNFRTSEEKKEYAEKMRSSLVLFAKHLKPPGQKSESLGSDLALTALSSLAMVFSEYPGKSKSLGIFQQLCEWIPWIYEQAKQGIAITFDLSFFLEAFHSVLLNECLSSPEERFLESKSDTIELLLLVLKIPWTHSVTIAELEQLCKAKRLSLQIISKMGPVLSQSKNGLDVLDLGLHDESDEVKVEAVLAMPLIVFLSGSCMLKHMLTRLKSLANENNERIKKILPVSIGFLACLYGSCNSDAYVHNSTCRFYLKKNLKQIWTVDHLSRGFWCSKCDINVVHNQDLYSIIPESLVIPRISIDLDCEYADILSLVFKLIYDESSEEVQVLAVGIIRRILVHSNTDTLLQTSSEWKNWIDFSLLHRKKAVREAFSSHISSFLEGSTLSCLFFDSDSTGKTKEQKFMDKIKYALADLDDPQIIETLLEATSAVMTAVEKSSQLFLFSLTLLIDQLDNRHFTVRMISSRLIHHSCLFHVKGGMKLILEKMVPIRNELYEYLTGNLTSRPNMVKEFAEAVLGVELKALVETMVPIILPKLIITHPDIDQARVTLRTLANCLDTDRVQLIMNWLPKVLAFALHHANERELPSALQICNEQTGTDYKGILAADTPALLLELVCFMDEGDTDEMRKRLSNVPQVIKKVANILTGSDDLESFLRNHFVRLLNFIDRKMLHSKDNSEQKQAMGRIEMLINMMGTHLTKHVPKLMVLFMYTIGEEPLQGEGLRVLHFFIKQLTKVSPSSTKHVISQVFAALIPFLEREQESSCLHLQKIVDIIQELVFKNRVILKQHIREFPPLPTIPALEEVNSVIDEARGTMTLKDQLRDSIDGLNHESLNVRYMVACELRKLLNLRSKDVTDVIIGEGESDMDVLSSLVTSLLNGCAEESRSQVGQRLKLVSADCLGALGAVDPSKVRGLPSQRFKIACTDDDLIFELIHKHLARAFRAAPDTVIQDSAALAIQELLKVAGCEASLDHNVALASSSATLRDKQSLSSGFKSCDERRGQRLWDRFSNYVKEIIAPCLTSKLCLPNAAEYTSVGPLYRPIMGFRKWIYFWILKLTVHATGSRASIFTACRGIVRHDMQTATYLLPYLVLDAVCHGSEEARHGITEEILSVLNAAATESEVCIQAVFTLLDNLGQWMDDVEQEIALSRSLQPLNPRQQASSKLKDQKTLASNELLLMQCNHVSGLLAAIPKVTLAKASFRCQAHARSLLYFESHVREISGSFNPAAEKSGVFEDEDITFLMEIYSGLDEPDGLSGLASLRRSYCLQDQLLIDKKSGNWAEVLTSCEQALQMEPTSVQRHSDQLNCLLNMCHLQAVVTHVDGLISRVPEYKKTWCMQGVQAAWRLGRWELMDEYLDTADEEGLLCSSSESNASFDMDVAKILQAMMRKDQFAVEEKIGLSKQALIAPLAAAGMDSYARAYPIVVKLHLLREIEDFHNLLNGESFIDKKFRVNEPEFSNMIEKWDSRLRFTQPSLWAREPLLAFRRLVFRASDLSSQVGNCWLQYAKLCRSAGHYEVANRAILEAKASDASNVHIEKAKLLWCTRRSDGAIAELQQSLLSMPVEVLGSAVISSITSLSLVPLNAPPLLYDSTQALNENRDNAKTLLLYSRWIHSTGQKQKEDVISLYSRVKEMQPKWEKGFFYMAKYLDEVLVDSRKRQEDNVDFGPRLSSANSAIFSSTSSKTEKKWFHCLPDVLMFYAKGLHRGQKNLFQALPRLLTLWFDFGSYYLRSSSKSDEEMKALAALHARIVSIMRGCVKDLPPYHWLTVLPQLVSRICHQNVDIVRLVKGIIVRVLKQYPQQGLWIMAAVSKSAVASRREAAADIIQVARRASGAQSSLFVQFAALIDHLIKLCFHGGTQSKAKTIKISTEFSSLKRMMPLDIIMPIQSSLTVNIPTYDTDLSDIFSATDLPKISGIADEAEVLNSLQRPKKVILFGSDGIERPFLCKPKDDLRKDARMMEFNAMINRLLSKSPESRKRNLYIRTFAVIPLTEDCGLVEWVPHTRGLRPILQDAYISSGHFDRHKTNPHIKRIYDTCQQSKMPEDEMLKNHILPLFPPMFHKWFLTTFSEPAAWFRARVTYAHTTAVWSMVGHIVGLGDRHGENILFDSTTGDCVHVDFSCLFDKGLQLEKPELVPFRLTQNMIDGLGITGYEGIFLRVCEITLSVLRANRETLMSVLETFIHDPLVEWTKTHKSSDVEVQNPHAQRAISNIEARLQGVVVGVAAAPSLPLAVEGQARRLIADAVSHKNLGKMYVWWMPWF